MLRSFEFLCTTASADNVLSADPNCALFASASAALLVSGLAEIESADSLPAATPRGHGVALVQEIQTFIADRASEDISLDFPAERFGTSRRHITRLFREQTGLSIAEFHRSKRISLARRMLTDTDLPVGEIAYRVGFESGSAPSRAMRRASDNSPSGIRRVMTRPVTAADGPPSQKPSPARSRGSITLRMALPERERDVRRRRS